MLLFIIFIILAALWIVGLLINFIVGGLGFIFVYGDILIAVLLIVLLFKLIFRKKK